MSPRHPDPAGGSHGQGRAPIRTAAELRSAVEGKDAFEILECIFEGDPLRIAERCRRRLHAEARLLDPDRVARAWVSQVAASLDELGGGDDLDEWLGHCGDPAIWSVMLEESEAARGNEPVPEPLPARYRWLALSLGLELSVLRRACVAFNGLETLEREAAYAMLVMKEGFTNFAEAKGIPYTKAKDVMVRAIHRILEATQEGENHG